MRRLPPDAYRNQLRQEHAAMLLLNNPYAHGYVAVLEGEIRSADMAPSLSICLPQG